MLTVNLEELLVEVASVPTNRRHIGYELRAFVANFTEELSHASTLGNRVVHLKIVILA